MDSAKRLSYLVGEDFYFVTYVALTCLDVFCGGAETIFRDHRKLSHLVLLISDDRALSVLQRYQERDVRNTVDRELLLSTFTNGEIHKREIYKLLFALEKRSYVELLRSNKLEVLDVRLRRDELPAGFLNAEEFDSERSNAQRLKKLVPRISAMSYETFLEKIYSSRGLNAWPG